jgi:hypothetical protein
MVENSSSEAILFFDDHQIVKEMTYAEFQAILDNYVPLLDVASRVMTAVYVRINSGLHVTGAVFFKIPFDRQGFVEKAWNLPLQQLADIAAKGPDLGSGPITLACYSQCPIEWLQRSLWDPAMQSANNDFALIKKTIKNNSLGLIFRKKDEVLGGDDSRYAHERTRAALLIKEQRLRHKLLATKAQQDVRQLNLDHQERVLAYQQQLNDYQQQLNEQRTINLELKETIAAQADKMAGIREYFESKLEQVQQTESSELETLKEYYESEILLQVESTAAAYKNELKSRDVELLYRSEREAQLQQEMLKLQKENQQLVSASGDAILERLSEAGVNFVIYHPGAGHLTIQPKDVVTYLSNTTAFVAHHCGVNEQIYRLWLDHFYSPTCQHELANGEQCDKSLPRLDDPSHFIVGESDCCPDHRSKSPSVVSISKHGRQGGLYSAKT